MFLTIALLIIGLCLILAGANFMTDGSVAIAKRFGMSDFLIGLTIVAMMTSAPELVVSITGAVNASSEMAIGNIVGSNIFNILVIIGITALVSPIAVTRGVLNNEIPLVILSSVVLLIMGCAPWLDGGSMTVTRVDGLLLLVFFAIFMRYTIASAKRTPDADTNTGTNSETTADTNKSTKTVPLWRAILVTIGGLACLILGGQWFVNSASTIARALGWSEGLIGLTILAAGTSLPELATSIVAATKGHSDLCIGNVIGSNIFNIFFVLGCTASIMPLSFGSIGLFDLVTLTVASVLFWIFGWFYGRRTITRPEGALLLLCYIGYITYLYLNLPA